MYSKNNMSQKKFGHGRSKSITYEFVNKFNQVRI